MAISQLERSLRDAPDHKSRSALKGAAFQATLSPLLPLSLERAGLSVVVDGVDAVRDKAGDVVGFGVMVRAFRDGKEVPIDPHRRFVNPPIRVADGIDSSKEDLAAAFADMLFESIVTAPAPERWGKPAGTVTTVYASEADGMVYSTSTVYETARSGSGLNDGGSALTCGQQLSGANYYLYEAFISFDTSAVPDTDTVSATALSLVVSGAGLGTNFTCEARVYDWGAAVTTADWVAGASLSSQTRVATHPSSSGATANTRYTFSEDGSNFTANVNKTGTTYLLLDSDRLVSGTAPTGNEYISWKSANTAGTTDDPKLVITHSGGGATAFRRSLLGAGF